MIKVLDPFVADKIAAGEVIERPVSAVKELIENSIDAGARSIIVEIRGGGKTYIRVTDDGCGIPAGEAETAFLRHATSKISGITDLDSISSLGFRGEALASIAAVSRLTMVSRTADEAGGIKLVLHAGRVISSERTGANTGTTIIAEDLFYNTPARRKFMRSDAREASAVIELVQQYAVCYAGIRFMMINSGQTLFSTKGDGDVLSVIRSLYPDLGSAELIPLSSESVRGFVSDPGLTRSTKKGQLFFVNGRLVSSSIIEKALIEGYCGRIFSGHPIAVLFIDADPSDIDVNIHPGKREIRFLRQDDLRRDVSDAVSRAVNTDAGVPAAVISHPEPAESKPQEASEQTSIKDFLQSLERPAVPADEDAVIFIPENHDNNYSESLITPSGYDIKTYDIKASENEVFSVAEDISPYTAYRPFDFSELVYKGYVFDTYIIMQGRDAVYIFDQHAAHERVFYEKFIKGYKNSDHIPQPLLTSFTLNVSADVYSGDGEWLGLLRKAGYDIEDFGAGSFMVRGVPAYMSLDEAVSFARGFAEAAGEESAAGRGPVIDKLIMRSCKSAVKGGDRLSELEINELMRKLSECENPYSCPHGRPTFIKMTEYEIEKSFRRRG